MTMDRARADAGPEARLVGVIGSPIAHSLSPLLHNAAFAALGLACDLALLRLRGGAWSGRGRARVDAAGRHQRPVGDHAPQGRRGRPGRRVHRGGAPARGRQLHRQSGRPASRHQHRWRGLRRRAGPRRSVHPSGKRCLVLGAGGAARAVVLALAEAGASRGRGAEPDPRSGGGGRRAGRPERLGGAGWCRTRRRGGGLGRSGGQRHPGRDGRGRCRLLAGGPPAPPSRPGGRRPGLRPPSDPLAGRRPPQRVPSALDGLGMLVHQAAAQLVLWTGMEPPVDAMWQAAEAAASSDPAQD